MDTTVLVRFPSLEELPVREEVLCYTSAVLEGILKSRMLVDSTEPRVIDMSSGDSDEHVQAFLEMAAMHSHAAPLPPWTTEKTATKVRFVMPLIDKYEATGLLRLVHNAVNEFPTAENVLAVLTHNDDTDWMKSKSWNTLATWCFKGGTLHSTVNDRVGSLPHTAIHGLLMYTMLEASYTNAHKHSFGGGIGKFIDPFSIVQSVFSW